MSAYRFQVASNNTINTDAQKRRFALLLHAGYGDVVRTLRARTTGRRIAIRMIAWRFAPHNHADQADIGRQSLRLFRPRGLSAAPLSGINRATT
jgi:hypothetical protein